MGYTPLLNTWNHSRYTPSGCYNSLLPCYSTETKLSKYPEKFGTGIIDGVVASETANNAATGGAMVPLLSLGIPTVTQLLL